MTNRRDNTRKNEAKRLEQIKFIMEHWDELPERIQGRFEGTILTASDFINQKTG
ncbi:hypothetical protein [Lacrimispora sp.]|uniref:hypothetical protein n=1 Tax=Lacrimispora sp. TaxID=2719234 RepID=UPI0028AF06A8|nr:hypothetical protein [Lacrimispora sp.]